MRSLSYITLSVAVLLFSQSLGAKVCRKKLKGKQGDIIVASKPCILDNVTAKIITVRDAGNLTVMGISKIEAINAGDGAIVTLKNKTFVGQVAANKKASIDVFVEKKSFVRSLSLMEAGNTRAEGPFGSVKSVNSAALQLISSTVRKDVTVTGGSGRVMICDSIINRKTLIQSRGGQLFLGNLKKKCGGSKFEKSVNIRGGKGFVTVHSAAASFVGIKSRKGTVSMSSSSFGKILVSKVTGDMNLTTSSTKGANIENIAGAVAIIQTSFLGEVQIIETEKREVGLTTIKESSFEESLGDTRLTVAQRGEVSMTSTNLNKGIATMSQVGPVELKGNGDIKIGFNGVKGLRVIENSIISLGVKSSGGGIVIEKNVIERGNVERCVGKVKIFQCVFTQLSCSSNSPAPVGGQNSISKSATGQCAKFK